MYDLILKSTGLHRRVSGGYEVPVEAEDVTSLLSNEIRLEGRVTLQSVLEALHLDVNSKVLSKLLNCNLTKLYQEMTEKPPDKVSALSYIEVSQSFELFKESEHKPWMNIMLTCSGRKVDEVVQYAIDLCPVAEISNLPIVLNDNGKLIVLGAEYKEMEIHDFSCTFTFYQMLSAIIDELSFFGSDSKKKEVLEGLEQQVADIESGKVELIPWEEVKKKLKL